MYFSSSIWKEPRRGSLACTACRNTIPCVNNYLTFGANNDEFTGQHPVSRITITQIFPVQLSEAAEGELNDEF